MQEELTFIDKKAYFEEQCKPLITELVGRCFLEGIPCFITAAVENNEKGTEYFADGNLTGSRGIRLKDDKIKYHMMIQNGCVAKPRQEVMEISMDELSSIDDI